MPPGHSQPRALCVSDILNALEINLGDPTEEPDRYLVVPGNSGPRWLIPATSRASASVLSSWRPYSMTGRVKWLAIRMAASAGILRRFPSVSSVTISRKSSLRWFERSGIAVQAGEMVILVGNPSPDRKLIVFLLDDAHRIAAVLKVGLTTSGGISVIREADVLRKLERYCWAPDILSVHPELGAAAQRYVHGTMPERGFRPDYMDLLCHLPQDGGSYNLTNAAAEMAIRLSPFADELHKIAPDLLNRCLSCLDVDVAVPTMLVHGDFVPWNLRNTSQFGYVLVDWEWANFAGLPVHDLLHFQFSEDRLFGRKGGGYAAIRKRSICTNYLNRMDLDTELFPRFAIKYLLDHLELECKYQGAGSASYILHQMAAVVESLGRHPLMT